MKIGFIGAGKMTRVLGQRLRAKGHELLVGSRELDKARAMAAEIGGSVRAGSYDDAAAFGELVFVALLALDNDAVLDPLKAIPAASLRGKILIDCNNPVSPPDFDNRYGPGASLAEDIASAVPDTQVVKAFNTVYAELIERIPPVVAGIPVNLFLAGDDENAKAVVAELGRELGFHAVDIGNLSKSRHIENIAAFEIYLGLNQGLAPNLALTLLVEPANAP